MMIRDALLTAQEVAVELRCSKAQVYKLINGEVNGVSKLPAIAIGRKKVVRRSSLESWKQANENGAIVETQLEVNAVDA